MNSGPNILDIPDELLIKIVSNLNAIERVPLGNSCKKFHTLVFEDKELLRDLDFSERGHLSSASDIHRYFINENSSRHILKVNLLNSSFGRQIELPNYVHKAVNLVDLKIHGLVFVDLMSVERFLCPFRNLERLSFDWPLQGTLGGHYRSESLEELLGRLAYWSVRLFDLEDFTTFYNVLSFCQELRELRITVISYSCAPRRHGQTISHRKLKNIEIIEYYGPHIREVEEYFVSLIPCPREWTHFQLSNPNTRADGFYLGMLQRQVFEFTILQLKQLIRLRKYIFTERNVEVCEELMESKSINSLVYNYPNFASKLGGFVSARLLEEVMKINGEHLQNKFCCFSSASNGEEEGRVVLPTVFYSSKLWTLKLEEAKRLLKDPKYQISYLNIFHNIEQECDAHVVTSAFSSLTELVLSNVTKGKHTSDSDKLDQLPNLDSSFSKLVKSTPHVKHLSVFTAMSQLEDDEMWDLASLHLIPGWQSLTSLRLWHIPIIDGNFFIEIGKQCKHLETIELCNLGLDYTCCYMNGLMQMLIYCTKLKYFALRHKNIDRISDLFFVLANNPQLRSVRIRSEDVGQTCADLIPPVERLLHCCSKLNKFMCLVDTWTTYGIEKKACRDLRSALERLRSELNRPSCQFQLRSFEDCLYEDESTVPYCIRFDSLLQFNLW